MFGLAAVVRDNYAAALRATVDLILHSGITLQHAVRWTGANYHFTSVVPHPIFSSASLAIPRMTSASVFEPSPLRPVAIISRDLISSRSRNVYTCIQSLLLRLKNNVRYFAPELRTAHNDDITMMIASIKTIGADDPTAPLVAPNANGAASVHRH